MRILDRSPVQIVKRYENQYQLDDTSVRFTPTTALRVLSEKRTKYPYIKSILYRRPAHDGDDAYDTHILPHNRLRIDLEARVTLDILFEPPDDLDSRVFPVTPVYQGMQINH